MPLELVQLEDIPDRWPSDAIADAFSIGCYDDGRRRPDALDLTVLADGTALCVTRDRSAWPEPAWPEGVGCRVLVRAPDGELSHVDGVARVFDHQGSRALIKLDTHRRTVAILDAATREVEVIVGQQEEILTARFVPGGVAIATATNLTLWRALPGPHGRRWVPEAYRDVGGRKLAAAGDWLALLDDGKWRFIRVEGGRLMHRNAWRLELPVKGWLTSLTGRAQLTWVGTRGAGSNGRYDEVAVEMAPWPDAKSAADSVARKNKQMVKAARKLFGFVPAPEQLAPEPLPLAGPGWALSPEGHILHAAKAIEGLPPVTFFDAHQERLGPEALQGLRDYTWRHAFAASVAGERAVAAHPDGCVYAVDLGTGAARRLRWAPRFLRGEETDVQIGGAKGGIALLDDGRFAVAGHEAIVGGSLDEPLQTCLWNQHLRGASVGVHDGEIWVACAFRGGSTFVGNKKELNEAVVGRMDLSANDGIADERRVPLLFPQLARGPVAFSAGGTYILSGR